MDQGNYKPAKQELTLGKNKRIEILGIKVDALNVPDTIALVGSYIEKKIPLHLMGVNADKINECKKNPRLEQIVNSCGVINADGASVVLASKFLGEPLPERVAGIDLMMDLVELSSKKNYGIYLLGARKQIVEKTAEVLKGLYPDLKIVGVHDGYFQDDQWHQISCEIKAAGPDIVFVGITSPKKEYLIEFLQDEGCNAVFMGVGGSFDVISGKIPRAPIWMQRSNLEWLFRVIQEPRRLFRRYFVGNWKFVAAVVKEKYHRMVDDHE